MDDTTAQDTVRNQVEIRSLLNKLVKQRGILSVTLDGFRRRATSAVLEVGNPEGYLTLDELVPRRLHERVRPGMEFTVYTRLDRVDLRFSVRVASIGQQDGIAFYRVRIPDRLRYSQRRRAFRSRVGAGKPIHITLLHPEGDFGFDATLLDLSATGFGALTSQHQAVEPGQKLTAVLPMPEEEGGALYLPATVTFSVVDEVLRQRRLGGRFNGLEPEIQRRLTSFVHGLQREQLRRLKELQED